MVFKCKICGGSLEIEKKQRIVTCSYCGVQQTLPKSENEKTARLYERANHFLRNNEYDKAEAIYETILNEDTTDGEAYWSLVLCKYGVEYVKDPKTNRYIPTCNRTQNTSIFADDNYKEALNYADEEQKKIYTEEAEKINKIQKRILEISNKEEPFDIFICYKETDENGRRTKDSVMAQELYYQLIKEGFKVFFARITLEDKIGESYEPYIFAALNSAKVMLVIGTQKDYINAVWVKNEWSRYLTLIKNEENKVLIPCYKDMNPYDLPEEFSHLQAQDLSKIGAEQDLIYGIKKIINPKGEKKKTKTFISLLIIIVIITTAIFGYIIFKNYNQTNNNIFESAIESQKDEKREVLRQDITASGGYTFNIKMEDLKEEVMKSVETTKYGQDSDYGMQIISKEIELEESAYKSIGIGWFEPEYLGYGNTTGKEKIVGIQIYYDSQGYVTGVDCVPTKYGSGDFSGLDIPINLYNNAKKAMGSEEEEWKQLVSTDKIKETVYDTNTNKQVSDGTFYAGMIKQLYINRE